MKIIKEEFLKILSKVKPGLSEQSTCVSPLASHFCFTGKEVFSYNDNVCIRFPFKTDLVFSVNAAYLYNLVLKFTEVEFDFSYDAKRAIVALKGSKCRAEINAEESLIDIPKEAQVISSKWKPLPNNFLEGVKLCLFSVSKDLTHGVFRCLCVDNNKIVSSDDLRISLFTLSQSIGSSYLLPGTSIQDLPSYDVNYYQAGNRWIHFKNKDGVIYSVRTMKGEFPNYEKFFELEGKLVSLPKDFLPSLDFASLFSSGETDSDVLIQMIVNSDTVTCRSEKLMEGWVEFSFPREKKGKKDEKFSFIINPVFLSEIVDKISSLIVGDGKALFSSPSFKHIMLLPPQE